MNGGYAMVKLNIYNMKSFLETVNKCSGLVHLILPDGQKVNMNKEYEFQKELLQKHKENKGYTQFSLDIPDSKDYIHIVCCAVVDC